MGSSSSEQNGDIAVSCFGLLKVWIVIGLEKIDSIFRLERDGKLGALEERADALQDGCAQFEKQAAAMKNKFWLENLKAMIAMGVVGVACTVVFEGAALCCFVIVPASLLAP